MMSGHRAVSQTTREVNATDLSGLDPIIRLDHDVVNRTRYAGMFGDVDSPFANKRWGFAKRSSCVGGYSWAKHSEIHIIHILNLPVSVAFDRAWSDMLIRVPHSITRVTHPRTNVAYIELDIHIPWYATPILAFPFKKAIIRTERVQNLMFFTIRVYASN